MAGLRKENASGDAKNKRAAARSWAKCLLSQLMEQHPDTDEFRVRLIRKPGNAYDVEVTVVSGRDPGAD